jgi:glycosyltransferase involved in cell wall biosynthesis
MGRSRVPDPPARTKAFIARNYTVGYVAGGPSSYTAGMINSRRVSVVMPAYNAEVTLSRTLAELDRDIIDDVVLVDDCSTDRTVDVARELGLEPVLHESNKGYGGNQKTCYRQAIDSGADIVVMVHPDYQYSPLLVPAMAAMIAYGEYDMVLGSRILAQNSVARGMPRYKYVANRFLTFVENVALNQKLSEYHTGLRAFSSELLAGLPFERNSDDFVFDNHIIAQAVAAGARIGEVSCPTRYEAESSSINLKRSIKYGFGVLNTCKDYRLNKHGFRTRDYLDFEPGKIAPSAPHAGIRPAAPGQVTTPEAEVAAESGN